MTRLTILFLLLLAPTAQAAGFGEQPFEPLANRGVVTCLRAAGGPGGLALSGQLSAHATFSDLRYVGGGTRRVVLGELADCAATAAAGGHDLVAGAVRRGGGAVEVRAALDGAGPVVLGPASRCPSCVAAAVSPAGHAVVAWAQRRGSQQRRIVAARRLPGGAFGPVEPLTPWRTGHRYGFTQVTAGVDAAGVATIAWVRPRRGQTGTGRHVVALAVGAPGRPFWTQRLRKNLEVPQRVALAVAPDGSTLAAYDGWNGIVAYERAPGAPRFTRAFFFSSDAAANLPTVAVRDGGGAVIAWRADQDRDTAAVEATTRPASGRFAPPRTVGPDTGAEPMHGAATALYVVEGGPPLDPDNAVLRSALADDGRLILAWSARGTDTGALTPRVVTGTLAGGFASPTVLGSPLRDVNAVAPLFLRDGRAAVAWTDNSGGYTFGPLLGSDGRLHVAVASAPGAAEPAVPRLRLRAAPTQHLFESQGLRVRASCDRPCDLRALMHGSNGPEAAVTATLRQAGTKTFRLGAAQVLRARRRHVRVAVQASGPGGHTVSRAEVAVDVIRRRPLPAPDPIGLRARRDGRTIVVTWRTAVPARRSTYIVEARHVRGWHGSRGADRFGYALGAGRTRFRVRLHPRESRRMHWVSVQGFSIDNGPVSDEMLARVRR